ESGIKPGRETGETEGYESRRFGKGIGTDCAKVDLGSAGPVANCRESDTGISDVGAEGNQHRGDLVSHRSATVFATHRNRHHSHQWLMRQKFALAQPLTRRARTNREDHVVDGGAGSIYDRLDPTESEHTRGPGAFRRDSSVEMR